MTTLDTEADAKDNNGVEVPSTFLSGRNENESGLQSPGGKSRAQRSVSLPLANDHKDLETVLDEQYTVVVAAAPHFATGVLVLRCREIPVVVAFDAPTAALFVRSSLTI